MAHQFNTFEDWKQTIESAYPSCVLITRSEKIGKSITKTVSAEQRNGDECFGVWYNSSQEGIVFDDTIAVNTQAKTNDPSAEIAVGVLLFILALIGKIAKGILILVVAFIAAESFKNTNLAKNLFGNK